MLILYDFYTKKIFYFAKIRHGKFLLHWLLKSHKHVLIVSSKNQIIYVKTYNENLTSIFSLYKKYMLTVAFLKALFNEVPFNSAVRSSGSLLESVQRSSKFVNLVFFLLVFNPCGWSTNATSFNSPYKNVFFMSNWYTHQPFCATRARTTLIVSHLATRANTSL